MPDKDSENIIGKRRFPTRARRSRSLIQPKKVDLPPQPSTHPHPHPHPSPYLQPTTYTTDSKQYLLSYRLNCLPAANIMEPNRTMLLVHRISERQLLGIGDLVFLELISNSDSDSLDVRA